LLDEATASSQEIRPARIGLMNLMPEAAMEGTEIQWLQKLGHIPVLQIEPVIMKFDNDRRETSRPEILKRYVPFSKAAEDGLDGLVITGDNLELRMHAEGFSAKPHEPLPPEEVRYYDQLTELFDWADTNVQSTIFSCLAAHFALRHRYGLVKDVRSPEEGKVFGVYDHQVIDPGSALATSMNDIIKAPHSRWGYVPID
jgi:homoserine O-succinyltransferase